MTAFYQMWTKNQQSAEIAKNIEHFKGVYVLLTIRVLEHTFLLVVFLLFSPCLAFQAVTRRRRRLAALERIRDLREPLLEGQENYLNLRDNAIARIHPLYLHRIDENLVENGNAFNQRLVNLLQGKFL